MAREISAAELRRYIEEHHEQSYRLVDVRQPAEYSIAHIPGALLLPLPRLVQAPGSLPFDKDLIFYCHSGGRSQTAAMLVEEEGADGSRIFNLDGGILAWDGTRLSDPPRIALFADQPPAAMLETAMNLEKGALRFYQGAARRYAAQPWSALLERLALAETGHARIVFGYLGQALESGADFEAFFDRLEGEVLEGGLLLETVLGALPPPDRRACLAVIEIALRIENAAYDLYRTMAGRCRPESAAEAAFLNLAESEKTHIRMLIESIDGCGRPEA